jgi:hypothetical protein
VTIPKVPDELHPVTTKVMIAKDKNRALLIMVSSTLVGSELRFAGGVELYG